MNTLSIRKDLHKFIDVADEHFLKAVHAMVKVYSEDEHIVGYTILGEPLTKKQLIKKVKAASARVKSGKFIRQEDIEKELE